ncbi:hypothetical protein PNEG_02544 [Pneumocystis murina B123]|uniref:CAF17 C-terminal domain-containing protein n=1 Tax=Pneumocystis murina (strain B123) TaxID=1069680 RepID=M7NKN8_PNEMU|nr:hypothetical protein PNEG_02544 [Pneumocystis murina B123]EMR09208.1 hypothetical protein PNEG_02544 [Pneumocystis murina B123]
MTRLNPKRRLIEIYGLDAGKFLQNMISNNIPSEGPGSGVFSGFFLPQGRILCDAFIYSIAHNSVWRKSRSISENKNYQAFFIECDVRSVENLLNHLKHYKLRSRVSLELVDNDEWSIWSSWGIDEKNDCKIKESIGCYDYRAPGMGRRDILPYNIKPTFELDEVPLENYRIKRYLLGVPEGPDDIFENKAFPIESCLDYMGGINFYKGCYIGQELTTRIYHAGVVRKRIVPISFYNPNDSPPSILKYIPSLKFYFPVQATNIVREDSTEKNVGKFCSGIGNIGLGLMRLDSVFNQSEQHKYIIHHTDQDNNNHIIGVKAFHPWWWSEKHINP